MSQVGSKQIKEEENNSFADAQFVEISGTMSKEWDNEW